MLSLSVAVIFFAITREISLRYSSEIFGRIRLMSIYAAIISVLSVIMSFFYISGSQTLEWTALVVLWIGSLHLWGMPWKRWFIYVIPSVSVLIFLISLVLGKFGGGISALLFATGGVAFLFFNNGRKKDGIPVIATITLGVLLLMDIVFPNYVFRAWEGIVVLYALVSRLIEYLHAIYHRSITDRLTGLYNRVTFMEYVDSFLKTDRKIAVIFLDIDNFKQKNDVEGHAAGDLVLIKTGELLKDKVRGKGVAGRMGGEELVLLVVEDNPFEIAESIRKELPSVAGITASIGVAYRKEGLTGKELIDYADDAMYRAKNGGKNRVVISAYE